jgi:hypothetical protein
MANWLESAFGLGDEAGPETPLRPRQAPPDVKSFVCVVRQPGGAPGDLGETVDAWYFVEHGRVTLCDAKGEGDGKPHTLADGDDPRRIASRLRRAIWQSERSPFSRPLHYRTFDVA